MQDDKPLVSYLLLSYNQERYIKKAVESAFAQTYSPLEIIISDDCSTDRTFEIIKNLCEKYKGPHKVIINQNNENLGITGNMNKILGLGKGELFVMAAGDDISIPERTQILFDNWHLKKDKVFAITSSCKTIDENGQISKVQKNQIKENSIESNSLTRKAYYGEAVAYSPLLYTRFGDLVEGAYEDLILYRRALMLGGVLFLKDKLVLYRLGGISTSDKHPDSFKDLLKGIKKRFTLNYKVYFQIKKDSEIISNCNKEFTNFINKAYKYHKLKLSFFSSQSILSRLKLLFRLLPYINNKTITFYEHEKLSLNTWICLFIDLLGSPLNEIVFKAIKIIKLIFRN